jgi:hypothetical protein
MTEQQRNFIIDKISVLSKKYSCMISFDFNNKQIIFDTNMTDKLLRDLAQIRRGFYENTMVLQ